MNISSTLPKYLSETHTRVATNDKPGLNTPLFTYSQLGNKAGYASATNAIRALETLTVAEAPAAAVVHVDGRFYGFKVWEGPSWLDGAASDFIGQPRVARAVALDANTRINFRDDRLVALVDGNVVLRREIA